jgi:hypothetical protein
VRALERRRDRHAQRGTEVTTNFGLPLVAPATPEAPDDEPLREARMVSAVWKASAS